MDDVIKEKFTFLIHYFEKTMPVVKSELMYRNAYELTVAVILSAQCTDKRVNMITPSFFQRFPTVYELAAAKINEIVAIIKSCSYPNNKARNLRLMAQKLIYNYGGILPEDPQEMKKLPGIGQKTAHVLASVLYNKPVIAVDTHVYRVSNRIGLVINAKTPQACEKQLMQYFPHDKLYYAHHWLLLHGRYVCMARKPKCEICGLTKICNFFKTNSTK